MKNTPYYEYYEYIRDGKLIAEIKDPVYKLFQQFVLDLDPVVKYMLQDRFKPSKPRSKKPVPKKPLPNSAALNTILELSGMPTNRKPIAPELPKPIDVIKGFKLLEQQLYHGTPPSSDEWEGLELGVYRECLLRGSDSLTALLLSIPNLNECTASAILSLVHTVICLYRHFVVKAEVKPDTITSKYKGTRSLDEVLKEYFKPESIDRFLLKYLDSKKMGDFADLFIYSGNASSPNSGHSSVNYLADVAALVSDKDLYENVLNLASCFNNGRQLKDIADILAANAYDPDYRKDKIHSRIVTFTAPGGKARIIVVADWVTQTALSAIHKTQFRLLECIPADKTFDHKSGLDIYDPNASSYYSVDLSAATDRLPRILQAAIIERLFVLLGLDGKKIARCWLATVDRTYSTKNSALQKFTPTVRYAVGQGMGLFSSWSSMALLHHYIVNELCSCPTDSYVLVGDDLLIKNASDSFAKYRQIMDEIGVGVNMSKTLVSSSYPHTIEFARNYVIQGHRIKPLPTGAVFAGVDKKLSSEEVLFSFSESIAYLDPDKLISYLCLKEVRALYNVGYFLWKVGRYSYDEVVSFLATRSVQLIISEDQFKHIQSVSKPESRDHIRLPQLQFTQSLLSQCSIRRKEDMERLAALSIDFSVLGFAGEEIEDYSARMEKRICSAVPISYEPGMGNPIVSKLEGQLIRDLVTTLTIRNPNLRLTTKRRR
jgi:hypothetical protein